MSGDDGFKRGMNALKRAVKRVTHEARGKSGGRDEATENSNVAGHVNVVVASNIGETASTKRTSATQRTRIRQNNGETYEESETTTSS